MIDILISVCKKFYDLKTSVWPTDWTKSLVITFSKKDVLKVQINQPCQISKQSHLEDHS